MDEDEEEEVSKESPVPVSIPETVVAEPEIVEPEAEAVKQAPDPTYVVTCTLLGGFDLTFGQEVKDSELGGESNVARLLANKSIATEDSKEGLAARQEYLIADGAVRQAKERGNA